MYKTLFLTISLIVLSACLIAQTRNFDTVIIELSQKDISFSNIVKTIEKQTAYKFSFSPTEISSDFALTFDQKSNSLKEILYQLELQMSIKYLIKNNIIIVKSKGPKSDLQRSNKPLNISVNGFVRDSKSGEALIGATIYSPSTNSGTVTNNYGFFSLEIPQNYSVIEISYVGYKVKTIEEVDLLQSPIKIQLESDELLKEVRVNALRPELQLTQMGVTKLSSKTIKSVPALLGEVDLLKTVQLLPGVKGGVEGSSGIYVRGGGPDQNLILLDGVPVYNASHLFGFFSIFNSDAVNNVEIYKAAFPSKYGGRLSSVMDISMKDGHKDEFRAEGSIGLISSKILLEGPVIKDKSTFMLSARRTYADLLARPFIKNSSGGNNDGGYFFYDINAKWNYKFSDKDKLYFSLYSGKDDLFGNINTYSPDENNPVSNDVRRFGMNWGNHILALKWNHLITDKFFTSTTFTYSKFNAKFDQKFESFDNGVLNSSLYRETNNGIKDFSIRSDFEYFLNKSNTLKFGAQFVKHEFTPQALNFEDVFDEAQKDTLVVESIFADDLSVYLEDELKIARNLTFVAGAHAVLYQVKDKVFHSIQPRLSTHFLVNEQFSLKASYANMVQYLHLLTNQGLGLPSDLWVPATKNVKPQTADQIALGAYANVLDNNFEISAEVYYKKMNNLIEYKDGANFLDLQNDWESKVTSGSGEAYGMDFLFKKGVGKYSGWLAYTLAWNTRQFEALNFGEKFPHTYDRRHDLSIVFSHKKSKRFEWNATWVFATGNAITIPVSRYRAVLFYEEPTIGFTPQNVYELSKRNEYRAPSYHRLDLGATWKKDKKWGEASWSIGLYNSYFRRNPFIVDLGYTTDDNGNQIYEFYAYSLFQFIPAISYNFKIYKNEKYSKN